MKSLAKVRSQTWYAEPIAFGAKFLASPSSSPACSTTAEIPAQLPARPPFDCYGDPLPAMRLTEHGIAIIEIRGFLLKAADPSDKFLAGLQSHEDVSADLDAAILMGARGALLKIASPGGTVTGTPELADKIARLVASGFPIISYTEDVRCSAAEYISAGCTITTATPSAVVGSIGSMIEVAECSKLNAAMGITYNIFTHGAFKAIGNPNKPMTDEEKEILQSFVSRRGEEFRRHMSAHRPSIDPAAMDGRQFSGADAAQVGLVDFTVDNLEQAVSLL